MIEFKPTVSYSNAWRPLPAPMFSDKAPPLVECFHYRINGIVYKERTAEFLREYEAEKLWYKLQETSNMLDQEQMMSKLRQK